MSLFTLHALGECMPLADVLAANSPTHITHLGQSAEMQGPQTVPVQWTTALAAPCSCETSSRAPATITVTDGVCMKWGNNAGLTN